MTTRERNGAVDGGGVSVVLCCHDSAERLPPTLEHLRAQRTAEGFRWEVVLVDNASRDGTAELARRLWGNGAPAPLRVVEEPRLGLSHARERGLGAARYPLVGFIDDDNWVRPGWVAAVARVLAAHPEAAACGGRSDAAFAVPPPPWFSTYAWLYAVGAQTRGDAEVAAETDLLWGAGLAVRAAAWREIRDAGFRSQLSGRRGRSLAAGEDVELCLALRAAGWKLRYEPDLRLTHFLPAHRLSWSYLRRLYRASAESTVGNHRYFLALGRQRGGERRGCRETWQWQVLGALRRLLAHPWKLLRAGLDPCEGDSRVFEIEGHLGLVRGLLRARRTYNRAAAEPAGAAGRRR